MELKFIVFFICCFIVQTYSVRLINNNTALELVNIKDAISINLFLDNDLKFSGQIAKGHHIEIPDECDGANSCFVQDHNITLDIDSIDSGFAISFKTNNTELIFWDCLDLNASTISWFGGPEQWESQWPIENKIYRLRVYSTSKDDSFAAVERYWLNSKGGYVFVDDKAPLYLDQNFAQKGGLCFLGIASGPYSGRTELALEYKLIAKTDPKEAHLHAVNNYLGKPQARPDDWVIRNPIWTTWAKYKKEINDTIVLDFAQDVANHNFTGQIEIDDYWETCYGDLTFNDQFANINTTIQSIKDLGFTVTLWVHPFVNNECEDTAKFGEDNGYFVKSGFNGSDECSWWDGTSAHYIDFTKEDARQWFIDRVKLLQDRHGFDAFKFDAGESDFPPIDLVVNNSLEYGPNVITSAYLRTCATFGGLIEVRSAWRTQDLGVLMRMLDKDSRWGLDNGLQALITSLLQFNMVGYVHVLPDMIGGNAYGDDLPSAELIARWTEANAFMPAMQFSFLPWEVTSDDFDNLAIVKKFVDLHAEYADTILNAMNSSMSTGTPVNPPVWWVDPTNPDAFAINDEYLLGEDILVAPVVTEGATSRDVFLPRGSWKDGNNGAVYEGPQTIQDYPAPIDVLPYFIRQN